jgi:hypothetical protein
VSWAELGWRALPAVLLTAWLLALIGGFSLGGLVNVLVPLAIAALWWNPMRDRSA